MEAVLAIVVQVVFYSALVFYTYANWRWFENRYVQETFLDRVFTPFLKAFIWGNATLWAMVLLLALVSPIGVLVVTQAVGFIASVAIFMRSRQLLAAA